MLSSGCRYQASFVPPHRGQGGELSPHSGNSCPVASHFVHGTSFSGSAAGSSCFGPKARSQPSPNFRPPSGTLNGVLSRYFMTSSPRADVDHAAIAAGARGREEPPLARLLPGEVPGHDRVVRVLVRRVIEAPVDPLLDHRVTLAAPVVRD